MEESVIHVEAHCHRWRIAEQGTANSPATCSCGAEREFSNVWKKPAPFVHVRSSASAGR